MDEIAKYNKERWEALSNANVEYAQPFLHLDQKSAREVVDPQGIMGDVTDKDVLCLASGGGQQSAAFGLLGASITIFDISETQLQKDRQTAEHYNLSITTIQGDMRDLSCFADDSFDIVWHAYSINFVPDPRPVFIEVARILRWDGLYRVECHNPFSQPVDDIDWTDQGYPLKEIYADGEVHFDDPDWIIENPDGTSHRIKGPREFRHTLSTFMNNLIAQGFILLGVWEALSSDPNATPGSWEHFKSVAPPWLTFWAIYRPQVYEAINPL